MFDALPAYDDATFVPFAHRLLRQRKKGAALCSICSCRALSRDRSFRKYTQ
jgi:hypothetical protein